MLRRVMNGAISASGGGTLSACSQSRGRYWYFSESRYSSLPGISGAFSHNSKPEYTPHVGDSVAASTARTRKARGPPCCRYSGGMAGGLTKKLGRRQPLPERQRLGVRVVHAEDPDPVRHPVPDDAEHLGVDALGVVVEVDRVDVLVLLRRVFRVCDRAVGSLGEPLGMLGDPRGVRRGLDRPVHDGLQAQLRGPRDERVEVSDSAQVRVDGVVTALG